MSNSTSTPSGENSSPFSFEEYDTLIVRIEMLYALTRKLSDSIKDQPCEYLIQQALMAFAKTVMSLLGFLRFIPSSRFHAKEREIVIDLSSASVMARQVMEDTLSFFYLSERNLTQEEKQFRKDVWLFHGATESIESIRFVTMSNSDLTSAVDAELKRRKEVLVNHPMLVAIESGRRGRIKKGGEGYVLHDHEILKHRGIQADEYKLGHKVLSNFAHFSALSHTMIMETSADWRKSWQHFVPPTRCVAKFVAEAIEAFLETFPQTRKLLSEHERTLVKDYRNWPPRV